MGEGDVSTQTGWGEILNRFAMEKMTPAARRVGGCRPPLRTLNELADEFGVTSHRLGILLCQQSGPKPKFVHTTGPHRAAWYEPIGVRTWWAALTPEQRKCRTKSAIANELDQPGTILVKPSNQEFPIATGGQG